MDSPVPTVPFQVGGWNLAIATSFFDLTLHCGLVHHVPRTYYNQYVSHCDCMVLSGVGKRPLCVDRFEETSAVQQYFKHTNNHIPAMLPSCVDVFLGGGGGESPVQRSLKHAQHNPSKATALWMGLGRHLQFREVVTILKIITQHAASMCRWG